MNEEERENKGELEALKACVEKSGILLESAVERTFRNSDRGDSRMVEFKTEMSKIVKLGDGTFEIDVYASRMLRAHSLHFDYGNTHIDDTIIHQHMIVECKGAEQSGMLIGRQRALEDIKPILRYYLGKDPCPAVMRSLNRGEKKAENHRERLYKQYNHYFPQARVVDWVNIYKQKSSTKGNGDIEYQQDKDPDDGRNLFQRAVSQVTSASRAFLEDPECRYLADNSSPTEFTQILPVIVVNIRLRVLEIAEGEVKVFEVPWFVYRNIKDPSGFDVKGHVSPFDSIYVVNLENLDPFINQCEQLWAKPATNCPKDIRQDRLIHCWRI